MKLNESNIFNKSNTNLIDYGSNNFNQNKIQKQKKINFFQNQKEFNNNLMIDENNNNNILNIFIEINFNSIRIVLQ